MRIDENMEVLLQSVANLFGDLKLNVFKEKLEKVIALPSDTSVADFIEEYTKWNEKNYFKKERLFVFSNGKLALTRIYIVSAEMKYTDEGIPEIIINEMPDAVNLKDNPYKNIHIRYENEDDCSRDFDRLKLVLN
jgi:hypothetical protein